MNQVVKVLVLFVTVASLSFMALTGAITLGGPNWWGRAQEMKEYTFQETAGDPPTYNATHRPSNTPVSGAQSPILAKTVVATLNDEKLKLQTRDTELNDLISREEGFIKILEEAQSKDLGLLEARSKEFQAQLDQLNKTIASLSADIDKIQEQTYALNESLGKRREDVLRLKDQLALVRTDRDRLIAERKELEDILVLLNASVDQLERRTEQLQSQN
jgi:hypothetical protein